VNRLIGIFIVASSTAFAQGTPSTDYPEGSEPLPTEALRKALSGKAFNLKSAARGSIRLQFDENGYAFVDAGPEGRDSGKWNVIDSKLCTDWRRAASGCTDARIKEGVIYIRRLDTGEVGFLEPK
jgi:hypothetical protein